MPEDEDPLHFVFVAPIPVNLTVVCNAINAKVGLTPHPTIAVDEPVSVCEADYAVAETASLVFRSSPHMPTLFAFLPLHHIVVLEAARIVPWLDDAAALEAARPAPRNLNFVTGASGTTDIEGTLVRGAHGPAHLHVLLIGGQMPAPAPQPANVP